MFNTLLIVQVEGILQLSYHKKKVRNLSMEETTNVTKQYPEEQYNTAPDEEILTGFTNYNRLLMELNNRMYYDKYTYMKLLNENGLDPEENYDKNTDHAKLLETVYSILQTLYNNIDVFRKVETEFTTVGEAASALQARLKTLRAEIDRVKAEMNYQDSDFTFMFYTRAR